MNIVAVFEWFTTEYYPRNQAETWGLLIALPGALAVILTTLGMVFDNSVLRMSVLFWVFYLVFLLLSYATISLVIHVRGMRQQYKKWKARRDQQLVDMLRR